MNGQGSLNERAKYRRRERRLRSAYRKKIAIFLVLGLALGFFGGWLCFSYFANNDDAKTTEPGALATVTPEPENTPWLDPTVEPTAAPTETPTAEPTAAPTAEPTTAPTAEPTTAPATEPTAKPTAAPTAAPTAEPTAVPTTEPTAVVQATEETGGALEKGSYLNPVLIGEPITFTAEVYEDGSKRTEADAKKFYSVDVTMSLSRYLKYEYYVENYSTRYNLNGTEAGSELSVTLGEVAGLDELTYQDAVLIVYENASGDVVQGFQLTNAEIGGETNSVMATGATTLTYKRYRYDASVALDYLTVTYYSGGEERKLYFSLTDEYVPEPDPNATPAPTASPETYQIGDQSDGVKAMQEKLIELGYLEGAADGAFGQMTKAAVVKAQEDFGLISTGIADPAFLEILWSK